MAEKVSQTTDAEAPAEGGERTVVDGRIDPEQQETVAGSNRRGARGATAPIPAPMEPGDTAREAADASDPRFLELASGDMVEERTDHEVEQPTIPAEQSVSTGEQPESINEQPTLIYRDEQAVQPKLAVIGGNDRGHEFIIGAAEVTLGRGTDCDVILADIAVSRRHVVLRFDGSRVVLRDLQSGNGTLVNGKRIDQCFLRDGDQIELGNTLLRFVYPVADQPADATQAVGEETPSSDDDRPSPAAGIMGGTPLVQPPTRASLFDRAGTAWSWLVAHMRETRGRVIAAAAAGVLLLGLGGLAWHRAGAPKTSPNAMSDDAEALFADGVRAFRANRWQDARQAFGKVLAAAPDNPKAKLYVERCDVELASGKALDDAKRAMAAHDYKKAREALDHVDLASFAFEDARAMRAELAKSETAVAVAPPPKAEPKVEPKVEPRVEPRVEQLPPPRPIAKTPPKPVKVASRSSHAAAKPLPQPTILPDPTPSSGFDKTGVAHYKAKEWGPAAASFKSAKISDDVKRLGQLWVKAEMDRSMNLQQAIKEYDEALTIDKRLPFSKGYHAPYLIAQLQKLTRAAATAAYAAGNYEQAAQAAHYAQKYAPNDPALGKLFQDLDGKARDMVTRAMSLKDSNPDQAKLLFRSVVKFAPKSSPSYQKAYQTLNSMAKPMQDEDE